MANESLSSVFGWVSLACWIVVYSPQFYQNYKNQSGQGLAVLFVVTWLLADLCSLVGAVLARLVPTVIMLAVYYTACDSTLLFQIYYYRWKYPGLSETEPRPAPAEEEMPFIEGEQVKRRSKLGSDFIRYATALLFVFATGVAVWAIDQHIHVDRDRRKPDEVLEWRSQVLGWVSAILFLAARIPQISKNFKTRCEGLSPALFLFSISGNTTYAFSICLASMEPKYLLANASWLAGSVLTIFLDLFVIGQFVYYSSANSERLVL